MTFTDADLEEMQQLARNTLEYELIAEVRRLRAAERSSVEPEFSKPVSTDELNELQSQLLQGFTLPFIAQVRLGAELRRLRAYATQLVAAADAARSNMCFTDNAPGCERRERFEKSLDGLRQALG